MLHIIAIGKAATVKQIQKDLFISRVYVISLSSALQIPVHILPVNTDNTCRIARTLHTSLNL